MAGAGLDGDAHAPPSLIWQVLGLGPKPCDVEDLQLVHKATEATQKAIRRYKGTASNLDVVHATTWHGSEARCNHRRLLARRSAVQLPFGGERSSSRR